MADARSLRIAVVTLGISHFEVPLYRLLAREPGVELRVFHVRPVRWQGRYDTEYGRNIDCGEDMLLGYDSEQCSGWKEIAARVRDWPADACIVNGYGWPGAVKLVLANRLRRTPQILRGPMNHHIDPRSGFRGRLRRPFGRLVIRLFDAYHYGGSHGMKALELAGISRDAMFLVPYSVDSEFFLSRSSDPAARDGAVALRSSLGWGREDCVALFIGQHNWFKGPDIAMEAFRKSQAARPNIRALIVGSGRMTEEMKAYAHRHLAPGSFHFAGFVPSKETVQYYLAGDIALFTSRYETWGRAVNEAMLCGRPCIVNEIIPASGGLVEDGVNGFVVSSPEAEFYVRALERFTTLSGEDRRAMGERARLRAAEFSYESHREDLMKSIAFARSRRA